MHLFFKVFLLVVSERIALGQWVKHYQEFQTKQFNGFDGWYIQNQYQATTQVISKCGDISVLGGYKVFGVKSTITKMIKIPPHYRLKFQIQLWKIGDWESDSIYVYVDGIEWFMKWGFTEGGQQLCGGPVSKNSDKVYNVEFELPHNSPTPIIVMTSNQKQEADVQSWGLREMIISYKPCPLECGICHNDKTTECQSWNLIGMSWFQTAVALEGWKLKDGKAKGSECSGVVLFGGYQNVGQNSVLSRTFTKLVPHSRVMLKFTFWKIDFWDNDAFFVNIDGKQVFEKAFQINDGVSLCGADETLPGHGEKIVGTEIIQRHNADKIDISFTSSLKKDFEQQSWGIRDLFLFVEECTKFCVACFGPQVNECTKCDDDHVLTNGKCLNKYLWFVFSKEFNQEKDFSNLNDWTISNAFPSSPNPPITKCTDISLVGGFKMLGKNAIATKTYTKLPLHDHLRFKVTLYKINQWDGEELILKKDNDIIWKDFFGWNDPQQSNKCSGHENNWGERIVHIDQIIDHKNDQITFELSSTLLKTAEIGSWGFRDVLLLYSPMRQCIELFSECGYQGKKGKICDDIDTFKNANIDFEIKSIKVPHGLKITGYSRDSFKGDKIEFETNQECLENIEFSF